jgi:lysozyme family protein
MANTTKDIVDDVMRREDRTGSGIVTVDAGGRTQYGISERANPEAWIDGKVTEEEAREIYERKYVRAPKFDLIPDEQLRAHLVDFGVNSGPMIAIMKLQTIIGADVDGVIGPDTLGRLSQIPIEQVRTQLVVARLKLVGRVVTKDPRNQLKMLNGWIARACEFL